MARRCGVSTATVSRALRGQGAPETSARIRAVAEELHFTPSRLGRSLAERQHAANGIVFPDLAGPYYAEVVLGYEEVAADLGRSVLILTTGGRRSTERTVLELAGRVDGLVIMGRTVDDDVVRRIAASGLPMVLVARHPVGEVDTITTESRRSSREVTEHLLAHGHRRFAFLGDPDRSPDVADRYAGFADVLARASLPAPTPVPCAFDLAAGRAEGSRLLRSRDRPDAVVCANDEVALGLLTAARERGLRVPEDLAITGWDDVMAARFAGLTTVRQPLRELGATAAQRLHERITEPDHDRTPARHEILPTRLVVRDTCGSHTLPSTPAAR
ncbi:LacI family DNA-binding transcriptional regulator [Micromonospora zhanjiangensis]|uniref:LacI family DNA-binding transcriptional regulator n=1 Tax=Micromonospora zhanjiangensis TaxID=1522057 RepID=A0ABV8KFX9_9ACTN